MTRQPCYDREYLAARIAEGSEVSIPGVGNFGKGRNVLPSQEQLDQLAAPNVSPAVIAAVALTVAALNLAPAAEPATSPLTEKAEGKGDGEGEGGEPPTPATTTGAPGSGAPAGDPANPPANPQTPPPADPPAGEPQFAKRPLSAYAGKTDEEIRAMDGVGDSTLKKIREALTAAGK